MEDLTALTVHLVEPLYFVQLALKVLAEIFAIPVLFCCCLAFALGSSRLGTRAVAFLGSWARSDCFAGNFL